MKVVKMLEIGRELLKVMSDNDIKLDDWKYIEVYKDFINMREKRVKYRSAIKMLAKEKNVSERTLERVFKRLKIDVV